MGYSFSMDDLKAYGEEMQQAKMNCELCDEELQAVSGGLFVCVFGGGGDNVVCVLLGTNSESTKTCTVIGFGE